MRVLSRVFVRIFLAIPLAILYVLAKVLRGISLLSLWHLNPWKNTHAFANSPAEPANHCAVSSPRLCDKQLPLLCIAISGGGSRAAVFGAAILFYLQRNFDILSRCSYISTVSGGALPACFFCLATDEEIRDDQKIREMFRCDYQSRWGVDYLLAVPRMLVTSYNATDVLAQVFDDTLFKGATFQSLRSD